MEYFVISSHCPELYKEVAKIVEDWGVSHRVKVVKSKTAEEINKKNKKNI